MRALARLRQAKGTNGSSWQPSHMRAEAAGVIRTPRDTARQGTSRFPTEFTTRLVLRERMFYSCVQLMSAKWEERGNGGDTIEAGLDESVDGQLWRLAGAGAGARPQRRGDVYARRRWRGTG